MRNRNWPYPCLFWLPYVLYCKIFISGFWSLSRQCSPTAHSEKLYRVRYKVNYHRCASDGDVIIPASKLHVVIMWCLELHSDIVQKYQIAGMWLKIYSPFIFFVFLLHFVTLVQAELDPFTLYLLLPFLPVFFPPQRGLINNLIHQVLVCETGLWGVVNK